MKLFSMLRKHMSLALAESAWKRKSIWLSYDFPDQVSWRGKKLSLDRIGLEIEPGRYEFLLDGFDYLRQLHQWGDFSFTIEDGTVVATNGKITVEIQTAEELFILREVWLGKDYNFEASGDVVVIDIGMNVGMASLYFASRDDVKHVYGFEPFEPTYRQCSSNLARNEELARKVTAANFGLSHMQQTLEVEYDFDNKGQVGIHGTDLIRSASKSTSKEKIELVPVLPEIRRISDLHPEVNLICKIDCEGAEYDLFRSFAGEGMPENIKGVMMEWHEKGPGELWDVLRENGFRGVSTYTYSQKVGMVYAFRS